MEEQEYYIAGEYDIEDDERGPFVVICSHYIDGNVADVYGETLDEAREKAQQIVDLLNKQNEEG
jgi:hypothetical protein